MSGIIVSALAAMDARLRPRYGLHSIRRLANGSGMRQST
jgi:hypothetical protein